MHTNICQLTIIFGITGARSGVFVAVDASTAAGFSWRTRVSDGIPQGSVF